MSNRSPSKSTDGSKQKVRSRKVKGLPSVDASPEVIEVNGIPRWEQPLRDLQENGCRSPRSSPRTRHTACKPAPRRLRPKASSKNENRGRARNFENTVLTVNIDRQKSIGDLTINMPDYTSPRKPKGNIVGSSLHSSSSSFAVDDLLGDEQIVNPLWNSPQRKSQKKKGTSKAKRSTRPRGHSYQVEPKSTGPADDQVSLSEVYCSWKEGSLDCSQDNNQHCHSSTSDLSSATSLFDEAYVFGGKKSPQREAEELIEMQEEEMVKLAMERSAAEFSLHSGSATSTNSSSTFSSSYESSCSAKACRKFPRPKKRGHNPYGSYRLAEAGCHLSMIGSDTSRRQSSGQSSLCGGPMLKSFGNLSDEEDDQMLPAPAPDPSFVWKRDIPTKKWYKKPIATTNPTKSEEDLMLEKASKLSMKDCLASSLNELQSVTTFHHYRYPNHA